MVAVGFGGRLMRTVSFLGCTLAASPGFGGTPPAGGLEVGSAILQFSRAKLIFTRRGVKCIFREECSAANAPRLLPGVLPWRRRDFAL
jgi:hypothetical protein